MRPTDLSLVFGGDADHVAWTTDVRVDGAGAPHVLFTVQRGDGDKRHLPHQGGADLRFMYGRWDAAGRVWRVAEAAHAGSRLYAPEVDYTGLGALHPYDPRLMYISTNAHPVTGAPLLAPSGRRVRGLLMHTPTAPLTRPPVLPDLQGAERRRGAHVAVDAPDVQRGGRQRAARGGGGRRAPARPRVAHGRAAHLHRLHAPRRRPAPLAAPPGPRPACTYMPVPRSLPPMRVER